MTCAVCIFHWAISKDLVTLYLVFLARTWHWRTSVLAVSHSNTKVTPLCHLCHLVFIFFIQLYLFCLFDTIVTEPAVHQPFLSHPGRV